MPQKQAKSINDMETDKKMLFRTEMCQTAELYFCPLPPSIARMTPNKKINFHKNL